MKYDPIEAAHADNPVPQKRSKQPGLFLFLSIVVCVLAGIVTFLLAVSTVSLPFVFLPPLLS